MNEHQRRFCVRALRAVLNLVDTERQCLTCGTPLPKGLRISARYCSSKCKVKARRERQMQVKE